MPAHPQPANQPPRAAGSVRSSLGAAVLLLLLFGLLALAVFHGRTAAFDLGVRDGVHQFTSTRMTAVMWFVTLVGSPILVELLVVAVAAFMFLHWRREAVWLLLSVAGALALDLLLKPAFHRPRPAAFFGGTEHSFGFPSAHALFSVCFYGVLAGLLAARLRSRAWRVVIWTSASALILAIGFSRVYLGVHYPSDVLAGYLLGGAWASALLTAERALRRRRAVGKD